MYHEAKWWWKEGFIMLSSENTKSWNTVRYRARQWNWPSNRTCAMRASVVEPPYKCTGRRSYCCSDNLAVHALIYPALSRTSVKLGIGGRRVGSSLQRTNPLVNDLPARCDARYKEAVRRGVSFPDMFRREAGAQLVKPWTSVAIRTFVLPYTDGA